MSKSALRRFLTAPDPRFLRQRSLVIEHRAEIAHIEPSRTHRAFQEMIGLGFGDAISVDAVAARNFPMGGGNRILLEPFAGALQRRIDFNGLDVDRSALRSESDVV